MTSRLLDASSRVAFAALLHDLGKFAERAVPDDIGQDRLDAHLQNYCKWNEKNGNRWPTRKHAAYTALFMDTIERSAPDLIHGDTTPFASRQDDTKEITDSIINAAAMHHVPETLLQWIIATADRVASGFEREDFESYNNNSDDSGEIHIRRNHFQARLLTLFEQIRLTDEAARPEEPADFKWCYPLKPLSPENIFPVRRGGYEQDNNKAAQEEYRRLWDDFLAAIEKIPRSHRSQWPLWLDHLDTLWQSYTHAIPSSTFGKNKPEISLYDHSKATAAFAVALWRWHSRHFAQGENPPEADAIRWHRERADWNEKKFLIVQGDFFGIQDFIFSEGADTNKNAAKLLRGRSFMVSLFTELAALRILEACELPPTSQINNAAGKFLIVAPNTPEVQESLDKVRRELNDWFLRETFGLAGLGLVSKEASCDDFLEKRFDELMKALFIGLDSLEYAKLQRFELTGNDTPKVFNDVDYPLGVCQYNNRLPADKREGENKASARLSRDQIKIGEALAHRNRLLIVRDDKDLRVGSVTLLEMPIFGYHVGFTGAEEASGKFGELAGNGQIARCWDFSLPENLADTLWHGYARRYINAYVPYFSRLDQQTGGKYQNAETDTNPNAPKTFNHLACEDRILEKPGDGKEKWIGQIALAALKGDVDNLGKIFLDGLPQRSFAKIAALSRQMNAFFAVWLPAYCKEKYDNTYTVFAGGDDFFLIGPWHSTQKLTADMAERFKTFAAENPEIHFSAGFSITKPGHPVNALAEQAEAALDTAKGYTTDAAKEKKKNAVCLYKEVIPWAEWPELAKQEQEIRDLAETYKLSTGYIYGLLSLIDLATSKTMESAMWRSRFTYRTRRYVVDKLKPEEEHPAAVQARLAEAFGERGIAKQGGKFRIPLFNFFYSKREG